jgi:pSer/pThr/pTyr-binding forkhead associated (FHA) protein
MNKTKDMDNHLKADTVIDFYAFSDKEHTLLPNDESLADNEHGHADTLGTGEYETAEYTSDGLECAEPDMQPPTESVEDSGDSANSSALEADRLHGPIWELPPDDQVANLVAALDSTQLEIERQAQRNRELNTRMREIRSLAGQPEERATQGAEQKENHSQSLDGDEDYLQALTAQTGRLDTMLDSLAQAQTEVVELNAVLDDDLNGYNELASKMQADEGALAELESLIDQHCGADPSGNDTRQNAVQAEPAHVDYLETLTEVPIKDRETLTEVRVKDDQTLTEGDADNRLLIAMKGDHVIKCPLSKSIVTIGRGRFNDIQIRTRCVSRSHARIMTNDSDAIIEDMNSKNGITVNGHSVQLRQLRNGDIVEVDKILFKFVDLIADERKRDRRAADDPAADSDLAADKGSETAPEMRDRRDRRDRRKETREPDQLPQRFGKDASQDAEGRPDRDAQSAKKPWWKFRE